MSKISLNKTTGLQAYKLIASAIAKRSKELGVRVHQEDFAKVSGLSRQSIIGYKSGQKPGPEGVGKIAAGLSAWGINVKVEP